MKVYEVQPRGSNGERVLIKNNGEIKDRLFLRPSDLVKARESAKSQGYVLHIIKVHEVVESGQVKARYDQVQA